MKKQIFASLEKCDMLLTALLLFLTTPLHARLPQLWPTFSQPSTIVNVGLSGQSGGDFMALTSFQAAYNQQQLSTLAVAAGFSALYVRNAREYLWDKKGQNSFLTFILRDSFSEGFGRCSGPRFRITGDLGGAALKLLQGTRDC